MESLLLGFGFYRALKRSRKRSTSDAMGSPPFCESEPRIIAEGN